MDDNGIVAVCIACQSFSEEKVVHYRELRSGNNPYMYFLAKNIVDMEAIIVNCMGFVVAFFLVGSPAGLFTRYYEVVLFYEFVMYGIAYICSWLTNKAR